MEKGAGHQIWRRWVNSRRKRPRFGGWHLFLFLALVSTASAAPPEATRLYPPGAQRGSTVTVNVAGSFPTWPAQAWTERPGTSWVPQGDSGTFAVTVAPEAALGAHLVRFTTPEGATAVRRFVVGHLPEIEEKEPNDKPAAATAVAEPVIVVNGVLGKGGDVDLYRVSLAAGETLVAQADANRLLGTAADLTLDVADARHSLLARNLDAAGLDPRVVFTAPVAGEYFVRVYGFPETADATIGLAGGEAFVYRLTLSKRGFLVATLPSAVSLGAEANVSPLGWRLPEEPAPLPIATTALAPSASGARRTVTVALERIGGAVSLPVVEMPVVVVPQAEGASAPPPVLFSGLLKAPQQRLAHRFTATKDVAYTLLVEGIAIGTAVDPILSIEDLDGKRLAITDEPAGTLSWKAPADGVYKAVVRDRRGQSGPAHGYRLTIRPDLPGVKLTSDIDRASGEPGKPVEVVITIGREHGFKESLDLVLVDPPAGVTTAPVQSPAEGDAAKQVALVITAAEPFSGPVRVAARVSGAADAAPIPVRFGPERVDSIWLGIKAP
jgi:Bacterial pre-peptidase C-terminal domain